VLPPSTPQWSLGGVRYTMWYTMWVPNEHALSCVYKATRMPLAIAWSGRHSPRCLLEGRLEVRCDESI
jgi:hypothetical protein